MSCVVAVEVQVRDTSSRDANRKAQDQIKETCSLPIEADRSFSPSSSWLHDHRRQTIAKDIRCIAANSVPTKLDATGVRPIWQST